MKTTVSQSGLFNPRALVTLALCSVGAVLAMLSFAATAPGTTTTRLDANSPQAPTQAGWSKVGYPDAETMPVLNGVTCSSASDCWVVGGYGGAFVEHWNGTSWSTVAAPSSGSNLALKSVTCNSTSDCWAVGYSTLYDVNGAFIERWNGTSWAVVTSPNLGTGTSTSLNGVTCNSASDCWAVGSYHYYYSSSAGSGSGPDQTLIERWNGTAWVILPSSNTSATQNNYLTSVSCNSTSDCWAVGYSNNGSVNQTLIEHWDGTLWTIVTSPNTNTTQNNRFNGVTCASASDCWAAGSSNNGTVDQSLIAHWNGTSWTIANSPNNSGGALLNSVACASASDCWAAGESNVGYGDRPLVERWNGTSWAIVTLPDTGSALLNGVACATGSECWAVGYPFASSNFNQTLIERWDGSSWSVAASPTVLATLGTTFGTVACVSASDCWAVGGLIIEHWNGTSWAIVAAPNANGGVLNSVACASASECWAVGSYYNYNGRANQTFIERWNGSSWSIVTSPNASPTQNYLNGVTCTSAADCWAVGWYHNGNVEQTLIERWNGTSWTIVSSPNQDEFGTPIGNQLYQVACASASQCFAIGSWNDGENTGSLIERWDGTSWSLATPAPAAGTLYGVTCASASECWAVGGSGDAETFGPTLIEKWDGTSWSVVPSPNASSTGFNILYDVTCTSDSQCWAVGAYQGTAFFQSLIEQWDGSSWSIVASPNLSMQHTVLSGVACASASECWAAGSLLAEYSPTIPPLSNVVSRKVHGNAGTFDINLPLIGTRGVECRSPGATGTAGVDYKLVFTFVNNVTRCGTTSTGLLSNGPNLNQCTVDLTGVANQQYITVTLNNVLDSQNNTGIVAGTMGVLIGDATGNGIVSNSGDVNSVKAQVSLPVTDSNFRNDINANGVISNSGDVAITKTKVSTQLSPLP